LSEQRPIQPPVPLADAGALVVGGSAGIGFASARALVEAGVPRVVLVARTRERGEAAAARLVEAGADAWFVQGNPLDPAEAARIAGEAERLLGRTDILVNSTAPEVAPELFAAIPTHDIARILTHLALPSMHMVSEVLPGMESRGTGVILTIASDAGKTATPGESVIGAAKAAMIMFTRTIAVEAKRRGVRANVLTPSLVTGTASTERITTEGFSARLFAKAAEQAHLGVPDADDLGALVAFLASPAAGRLTGQAISVNGGISAA
jgi:2-hydroxycyclohexanecarboxyl-CoA dehydrogenase